MILNKEQHRYLILVPFGNKLFNTYKTDLLAIKHFISSLILLLSVQLLAAQGPPVANFTASAVTGCSPLVVYFKDASSNGPTSWTWDLGNGKLDNGPQTFASYVYDPAGNNTYTVFLNVRNADGVSQAQKTITVLPSPTANFTVSSNVACAPSTIQFNSTSAVPGGGAISSYSWDFGDGTSSTAANPSHTYTNIGYYNVSLVVTTASGCSATVAKNRVVRIIGGVKPNFDFKRAASCDAPVAVTFNNLTTAPGVMQYQWTLGNGNTSTAEDPATVYPAHGDYTVTLVANSSYGCTESITKTISLPANATSFTSIDVACPNNPVVFTNSGATPVSSYWDFGDGTSSRALNPSKSFANPGTYTVTLTNRYGDCSSTFTKTITVALPPPLDFQVQNGIGCQSPHTVQFTDATVNSSNWLWDFGDDETSNVKNPQHTYTTPGTYNVTLTLTNQAGCVSTVTKNAVVTVRDASNIAITAPSSGGCVPFNFTPTASATTIDGIASYQWDFGDGGTATGASPTHNYAAVGTYTVRVTMTTNNGCVINYEYPEKVLVGTPPTVDFTVGGTLVCAGDETPFQSLATPADHWLWDFGDGSTSTLENPTHQFEGMGSFTISLTAVNNGCAVTATKANIITAKAPVTRFDPVYNNCANPFTVNFQNNTLTEPAQGPTTYLWNFGNGQTSTLANPPAVTYAAVGDYIVTLTARDNECEYIRTLPIEIFNLAPTVIGNKARYCRNETASLSVSGALPRQVEKYEWSVNGGAFVEGGAIFRTRFAANGTYPIVLRLTDVHGCPHTIPYSMEVVGSVANFDVVNSGGCRDAQLTLNDLSTPAGSIKNWNFDFGDGTNQSFTVAPFTHTYANNGSYNIRLTATDNFGCSSTVTKIGAADITYPQTNFSAEDSVYCQGTTVQFANATAGNSLTYLWDFGDGATSTLQDPTHIYNGPDSAYTVRLIVTDINGCKDTLDKNNFIRIVAPRLSITATDTSAICPPLETQFVANVEHIESLTWDFGDGNTSSLPQTNNFYDNYGTYTATLTVTGYHGCQRSVDQVVNLYNPQTTTTIAYGPLVNCNTITSDFTITPTPGTTFILYFGDGTADSSGALTLSHTYQRPSVYKPYIELTDELDCKVVVTGLQNITVNGVYPDFSVSKHQFCDNGTVTFRDLSLDGNDEIITRDWTMGDGATYSGIDVTHQYAQPGTYYVTENLTTLAGCSNSFTDTIRVFRTPVPVIVGPNEVCLGTVAQFNATTLVADSLTIWKWTLENGQSSADPIVFRNFPAAGDYTLQLHAENKLGCGLDTSFDVTVWPLPVINNVPEIVTPVGIPITLPFTYSGNINQYNWTPKTGLTCSDCPQPTASPQFNTSYKVEVTDEHNCKASSSILVKTICTAENYFVPNTFSPNNDGQNDYFYPRGTNLTRIQSMRVFNRWGEVVFEKKNFNANNRTEGWNGMVKGMPGQMDAYVYIIEVICDNAQIVALKGNVTLIR